jgi:ABC-type branched-subunit amino acid transport system substrate-binding protein
MSKHSVRRSGAVRRTTSFLAVVVSVVVVAGLLAATAAASPASDEADAQKNKALVESGPMTTLKAKLQGKTDIDFGPNCDTTTGRVKIPSVYAPPCVQPFTGKNGGSTSQGVTDNEIKIVVYNTDPAKDPLVAGQLRAAGAELNLGTIQDTWQGYIDIYNQMFELYGRKVSAEYFTGTAASSDSAAAKADAIAIADKKPFAVLGGPQQSTTVFADELAHRDVLCLGTCATAVPQRITDANKPYILTNGPSPEQGATLTAEFVGKQAGPGKAEFAGDDATKAKNRVYGIVHYDTPDGQYKGLFETLKSGLKKYKITPKADQSFFLDLSRAQETARTVITKMKDAGVTTIIYTGDPLMPSSITKEATAQDYHPEWIVGPTVLVDTAIFGRTYDQTQWAHAFGVQLTPGRTPESIDPTRNLYEWFHGSSPPNNTYGVINPSVLLFARGVQLAGPKLTPQSFRDGLFRYPPSGGDPINPRQSWGKHGAWASTDYYGSEDAAMLWWDPSATGEDEVGQVANGLYRAADGGKRYTRGKFPPKGQGGLFDAASAVTIFEQIPPEVGLPSYPPPASGSPSG